MSKFGDFVVSLLTWGKKPQKPMNDRYTVILEGERVMADVQLNWVPAPTAPNENLTGYNVYKNGAKTGAVAPDVTVYTDLAVTPGIYTYEVVASNIWGEGPKSDPVKSPPAASKVQSVSLTVKVSTV
jgi:hypothetical protein